MTDAQRQIAAARRESQKRKAAPLTLSDYHARIEAGWSESRHQIELLNAYRCAVLAGELPDRLIAVKNEGRRSERTGFDFKRQGMRPGTSDLLWANPQPPHYAGLWIELKRLPGAQVEDLTAEQAAFLREMAAAGYAVLCAFGWRQAWRAILDYEADPGAFVGGL